MDCVEAVRVHGGGGLVSITPLHTAELPGSMAWLSPTHRLCFGTLDHSERLHTSQLGMLTLTLKLYWGLKVPTPATAASEIAADRIDLTEV